MPPQNYDYLDQNIVATCLIQAYNNDSFYNPTTNNHSGFAADGTYYLNGVQQVGAGSPLGPTYASWYLELANPTLSGPEPSRDASATFPAYGIILLSPVAMTILDESTPVPQANQLKMWMQFALADGYMMTNNYATFLSPSVLAIQGFTPSGLSYADGIISISYTPDSGNQPPAPAGTLPWVSTTAYLMGQVVLAGNPATAWIALSNSLGMEPTSSSAFWATYPQVGDSAQSHMVVSIDFSQDAAYVDVAL